MEERKDDLQSSWDVTQGSRDQVQHSTHCACLLWLLQTLCMSTPQAHRTTGHATNTPSGDTVAPESGWLGNPLHTKCSTVEANAGGCLAPTPSVPGGLVQKAEGLPEGEVRV